MGFLKGGAIGGVIGGLVLLSLVFLLTDSGRHSARDQWPFTFLLGASLGVGLGGVIGAVRKTNRQRPIVVRRVRRTAPDPRPRLLISALYASTLASVGTLLATGVFGRSEVTRLVGAWVPYEVTSLQARLMLSGTLLLGAYTLIAGTSMRAGPPGRREQSLIAGAGFLTGVLGLPSLAVVLS